MKKRFLYSVLIVAASCSPVLYAQDSGNTMSAAPSSGAADTTGTDGAGNGDRAQKMKAALEQLGLSDSQKQQIKQIRANTQPGKDRRQQIMAVLTPDQKQKLMAMFQQYRAQQGDQ